MVEILMEMVFGVFLCVCWGFCFLNTRRYWTFSCARILGGSGMNGRILTTLKYLYSIWA